jgi:hypothetical protein
MKNKYQVANQCWMLKKRRTRKLSVSMSEWVGILVFYGCTGLRVDTKLVLQIGPLL